MSLFIWTRKIGVKRSYLFKENHALLYDHFDLCKKRLEGLYGRLRQEPDLLAKWNNIFIAQNKDGVIEEVPDSCEAGGCHYLPHHPVIKGAKDTTKVHIVMPLPRVSDLA